MVKFKVADGLAQWADDEGNVYLGGGVEHELEEADEIVGSAVAAGSLVLLEGDVPLDHVEDDEVSLEKLERVMAIRAELVGERDEKLNAVRREYIDAREAGEDYDLEAAEQAVLDEHEDIVLAKIDEGGEE